MPSRCCVPLCRGNYPNGPKVSVFGFLKDETMKKQWLAAIQRKSFIPNTNSKVCELHLSSCCFITESRAYDEKSGTVISIPLQVKKLKQNAVPSIFPEYPKSLASGNANQQEHPLILRSDKEKRITLLKPSNQAL